MDATRCTSQRDVEWRRAQSQAMYPTNTTRSAKRHASSSCTRTIVKWRLTVIPRFPLIRVNANNSLALSLERNDHDNKHNAERPAFESTSFLLSESKEKEAISLP